MINDSHATHEAFCDVFVTKISVRILTPEIENINFESVNLMKQGKEQRDYNLQAMNISLTSFKFFIPFHFFFCVFCSLLFIIFLLPLIQIPSHQQKTRKRIKLFLFFVPFHPLQSSHVNDPDVKQNFHYHH